jgi:hypothetical protein
MLAVDARWTYYMMAGLSVYSMDSVRTGWIFCVLAVLSAYSQDFLQYFVHVLSLLRAPDSSAQVPGFSLFLILCEGVIFGRITLWHGMSATDSLCFL